MTGRPPVAHPGAGGRSRLRADAVTFARLTGWEYFPVAFAGRLPFAMMIVGLLTFVVSVRGSVAEAAAVAAVAGVGTAVCGPGIGALADRIGQRRVLLIISVVSILASGLLLFAVSVSAPTAVLLVVALVLGGSTPQVAPFSRARLVGVAALAKTDARRDHATSMVMSYESVADESSFVLGPVLVGLLTSLAHPAAPLVVSMLLTATVVVGFALHRSERVAASPVPDANGGSGVGAVHLLLRPGILVLLVATFLVGGVFGAILTAVTGFMRARGAVEASGIVYGAMSLGAIAVAVIVAAVPARFTLPLRWLVFGAVGLIGSGVLAVSSSIPGVIVGLVLAGCGIGAVLVTLFSLGAAEAPAGRATTVLTALQSMLVVGQALVTAGSGALIEATDAMAGFLVAGGLVGLLTLLALVRIRMRGSTA